MSMKNRLRLAEVERVAFNTARILDGDGDGWNAMRRLGLVGRVAALETKRWPATATDEGAHDRLDRLEYRLKYGDAAYADYARLRSDGLNHAQAARAERTATKRAALAADARNALDRTRALAEQDEAVKDELIRSLARDVQTLMTELSGMRSLAAEVGRLKARFDQTTQSSACPCPEHLGSEDCWCGGSEC